MTRINTNVPALIAIRRLSENGTLLSKSLERLSTGFRINSAADDPAGLIISERLRTQIATLRKAVSNNERAQNLIRTAEGSIQEINTLLLSMVDLATEAANTGALSAEEIDANQNQIDAAIQAIDRIANTAKFGTQHLLDGTLDYTVSGITASTLDETDIFGASIPDGQSTLSVRIKIADNAERAIVQLDNFKGTSNASAITLQISGNEGTAVIVIAASSTATSIVAAVNAVKDSTGVSAVRSTDAANSGISFLSVAGESSGFGSDQFVKVVDLDTDGNGTKLNFTVPSGFGSGTNVDYGRDVIATVNGVTAAGKGRRATINTQTLKASFLLDNSFAGLASSIGTSKRIDVKEQGGLTFQLGSGTTKNDKEFFGIKQLNTFNLGSGSSLTGFLNQIVSGQAYSLKNNPDRALRIIQAAVDDVTALRGRLGAEDKNVIQSNIASLQVTVENMSAAESRIRDTDFASETAEFTRLQILVQAGTAILAQANLLPQSVLQLLG